MKNNMILTNYMQCNLLNPKTPFSLSIGSFLLTFTFVWGQHLFGVRVILNVALRVRDRLDRSDGDWGASGAIHFADTVGNE